MGLLQRTQDIVTDTAQLLIDVNNRFTTALSKINTAVPTYDADDLVEDVTQVGLKTLLLWLKFWQPMSDPLLPTLTITDSAANIKNGGLNGTVSLARSIPVGVNPTVTPLVFVGWSVVPAAKDASQIPPLAMKTPIPDADMDALRQQVTVYLSAPSAPSVERGLYQGFVLIGSAPIATVVVQAQ